MQLAEKYCGHWESKDVERKRPKVEVQDRSKKLGKSPLAKAHVCLIADGPSASDEERYEAQVLSCILGDSSGSRLYWELIDKGLADAASIDNEEMDGAGIIYGYVSAPPDRVEQVSEILQKVMGSPLEFSDAELERAKTKIRTRVVLQGESSLRRLLSVGLDWIYRQDYSTLDEELSRYAAVSRKSIEAMLAKFNFHPVTKVQLLPE